MNPSILLSKNFSGAFGGRWPHRARLSLALGSWLLLFLESTPAGQAPPPPDLLHTNAPALRIVNQSTTPETPDFHNAIYVQRKGLRLRSGEKLSADNGRSWHSSPMTPDFAAGLPHGFRRNPVTSVCDPETGRFLTILNALDTPGLDPQINEPPIALETYYLRYRVSTDGGMSWRFDEPIVQAGPFTQLHPCDGVWVGTNSIFLGDAGCLPLVTRKGRILVPAQATVIGPAGKLWNPGGGYTYTDLLVLIGKWAGNDRIS